ncbi:MAG: type I restriction endonuclease subunit R [Streptosporangiaceae bacterium]
MPLITQLKALDWGHIEGSKSDPGVTGRGSFREVFLEGRLRDALRRINQGRDGQPWLDEGRVSQAVGVLLRPKAVKLVELNQELTERLLLGATVDGVPGWDHGRDRTVQFIDWEHPERNDFLVVNQFRVDEPGGQGHKFIAPDLVLFVNGIPLVVIEAKSPTVVEPMVKAIRQLRRYAGQRGHPEGNERLFHTNQFVVATCFEKALVGTFSSEDEHYAEWKTTEPVPEADVCVSLGVTALSSQERLVAGMLAPERLLDLVRHFTLFMQAESRTVKVVARYQQYRAVHRALERLTTGPTRAQDGESDRRGGIVWHTQGSGKSLSMVFLVRAMRTHPDLVRFKVVVVTDRSQLQDQLSKTAALTGESVLTATSVAKVRGLLSTPGKALIFAMIQKYRNPQARRDDDAVLKSLGVLDISEDIVVLVDEAHRSQGSALHANLLKALPNCARIGFTGTPIIMGARKYTSTIFGEYLDRYTILQSEADGATLPILYEGRTAKAAVRDSADMDELFEDMFAEHNPQELEAIRKRWATKGNVLEAPRLIAAKARSMLRHYVDTVLPNRFKAQVVATSRLAVVRYREAFLAARDELLADLDRLDPSLRTPEAADRADRLPGKTARLVRAWPFRDVIAALEFIPVISGEQNDPADWADWTDKTKQDAVITQFKNPLPAEGDADPEHTSSVAFLIVKSMLLTGFDAPAEQVMYLDRHIKEAELLQAIARVNRTAHGKNAGYVVDYFGVAENLKVALAAYAAEDVEGAMTSVADQVPLLAERRQRVRNHFEARGIDRFDTQADQDACVEALADERLRAAFEAAFKLFTMSMEIVLPRPEALPYVPDAKAFGAIAFAARRRYREVGFDASLYGSKVRRLIDDHVEALGIEQKIPPISITAADFDAKVADLHSDRAKASEMEHAIRHHLREHWDEDPEHYDRLSERLEQIIEELGEQWEQLALALGDLLPAVRAGRQADDSGLNPVTEAPFYDLLRRELADEGRALSTPGQALLQNLTVDLVSHIKAEIGLVGFWHNTYAQNALRAWVATRLAEPMIDGADLFDFTRTNPVASRLVELAKVNHARLMAS